MSLDNEVQNSHGFSLSGFLTFINCRSVRWAMNVQDVFTFAKLLALGVIIISGLVHIIAGKDEK